MENPFLLSISFNLCKKKLNKIFSADNFLNEYFLQGANKNGINVKNFLGVKIFTLFSP